MVVFYVILVAVLTIALVLCIAKITSSLNEVYDEYRHVIEEIVSMESKIEHIMKTNVAQGEWIHTCTECLKELSKHDSHIIESLGNVNSVLHDNAELVIRKSSAIIEILNTIPTKEDMYDELTSQTAEITEAIKATKKTTKAKTAKA